VIDAIVTAAMQVVQTETITVQTHPGSNGKSCEINPAACKDPEYKTFEYHSVPTQIMAVAHDAEGELMGSVTITVSIDIPDLNLGPFDCENAKSAVGTALDSMEASFSPAIGVLGDVICSILE
jgi:hypothetical protein